MTMYAQAMYQWSAYSTFILAAGFQILVEEKKDPSTSPFKNSADQSYNENIHPLFLVIHAQLLKSTVLLNSCKMKL